MKARDKVALDIGRVLSTMTTDNVFASRPLAKAVVAKAAGGIERAYPGDEQETKFRNRERELDEVVSSLNNDDASHFWLFVAPPQLGKTWFLRRVGEGLKDLRGRCLVHWVDVRGLAAAGTQADDQADDQAYGQADDAIALLARMYKVPGRPDIHEIATAISRTGRYNLCLLDGAELLSEDMIRALRAGLEEIAELVKEGMNRDARTALVAASRQDDAWHGVTPLRLTIRNLTEFGADVVLDALCDLAAEMGTEHTRAMLRPLASEVHQLSEGLPAVLAGYLAWIRREEWIGLDRLARRDSFDEIATPYIQDGLLSPDSLYGRRPDPPAGLRVALIEALRVLVPYRFFTGSHLSYHAGDRGLRDALGTIGWTEEEVRAAVSRTDVLLLPQDEPWDAISPPIRRLLFRHWYAAPDSRARAHQAAREFLESYARNLTGRERAEVAIECLWHEAEALSSNQDPAKVDLLEALARKLSGELTEDRATEDRAAQDRAAQDRATGVMVSGYRDRELRKYLDRRMRDDAELARAVGDAKLFASITAIMMRTAGGNMP